MNATVVVAIRRRRAAHRASVSSKIPAIAGPAAERPDQNRRFARNTAHACVPAPPARATKKLTAPSRTSPASTRPVFPCPPLPRARGWHAHPFFARRAEVVDDVPPLLHREGLAVSRHDRAAVADVVGEVPVRLRLHRLARQVRRGNEPRRDQPVTLAAGAVAGGAVDGVELLPSRERLRVGGRPGSSGPRTPRARRPARGPSRGTVPGGWCHRDLAGNQLHVVLHAGRPAVADETAHHAGHRADDQEAQEEHPLHARTSSAPAPRRRSSTARRSAGVARYLHAEAVGAEAGVVPGRHAEGGQPRRDQEPEQRAEAAEQDRHLEGDDHERRDRDDRLAAGDQVPLERGPDRQREAAGRPGQGADQREQPDGASGSPYPVSASSNSSRGTGL